MKRLLVYILIYSLIPLSINAHKQDSIFVKKYNKVRYFDSDSIFTSYAQKGYLPVINELHDYYENILNYMTLDDKRKEFMKICRIAKERKSQDLIYEAKYMQALILPEDTEEYIDEKIAKMQMVVNESSDRNDIILKLRSMEAIFDIYWKTAHYAKALKQGHFIDKELQKVSENEYPGIGNAYYRIGKAFYFFKDYNKAIPYLRKAISPSKYYFDRSNLLAKNAIGKFYMLVGRLDSAEYYFRSAFFETANVKSKSLYDAIALSNIGQSLLLKQEYDSAYSYLYAGMKRILQESNFELSAEAVMAIAKCYLEKGDIKKTKQLIDSAKLLIRKSENPDLYQTLYPLMCQYYTKIKNIDQLAKCTDSVVFINKMLSNKYSGLFLLRAEQEFFEAEKQAKDDELRFKEEHYKSKQRYALTAILIISAGLIILMLLYRKNKRAYRALVHKNQEWAQVVLPYASLNTIKPEPEMQDKEEVFKEEPSDEDTILMKKVHELVVKEKIFKDLDLTLESLAKRMDINRNYLSKAINKTTGKNFNAYINEYRVKEAIKLLSSEKSDIISIDAIALEVGFNNRTSFYQSFRKITGLSPSDFRNNRSE